ncbi:MAG: ABC transporter permease [Candidatus Daviesbacteria bacterium]
MKNIQDLIKYKDLFWQLTLREIKAKYKQSVLGYAWVVLVPLMNMVVLSIIFSNLFRVPTGNIPYPIYLFVALVPWIFLSNAITTSTSSIISNSSLITKVSLPREILPISVICARLFDLLIMALILIVFLFIFHIQLQFNLIWVPLILIIQLMLIIGMSLILSATNVFFRDIEHAIGVLLTIWMYLTPVIYSPALIPSHLKILFNLNPMAGIIESYRAVILYGHFPSWDLLSYSALTSTGILLLGFWYFKKRSKYFADVI